jgi:hypothetical protein
MPYQKAETVYIQVLLLVNEYTHLDWYVLSRYIAFSTLQLTLIINGYVAISNDYGVCVGTFGAVSQGTWKTAMQTGVHLMKCNQQTAEI